MRSRLFQGLIGYTFLEGVCIRLTSHLHNYDMTHVMNMKVFMHVYENCH